MDTAEALWKEVHFQLALRQAVLTYLILCQENPEAGKVWLIERTGAVLGRGPRVIYDLVARWQNTREIIVHDPANRGRGSPKFVFRPKGFHPAVIDWLKARIESSLKAGRTVRVPWLAHDLFAEWKLASSPDPLRRPQEAGRGQLGPLRGPQRQLRPHIVARPSKRPLISSRRMRML